MCVHTVRSSPRFHVKPRRGAAQATLVPCARAGLSREHRPADETQHPSSTEEALPRHSNHDLERGQSPDPPAVSPRPACTLLRSYPGTKRPEFHVKHDRPPGVPRATEHVRTPTGRAGPDAVRRPRPEESQRGRRATRFTKAAHAESSRGHRNASVTSLATHHLSETTTRTDQADEAVAGASPVELTPTFHVKHKARPPASG